MMPSTTTATAAITTTTVVAVGVDVVVAAPSLLHGWRGEGAGEATRARAVRQLPVPLMCGGARLLLLLLLRAV